MKIEQAFEVLQHKASGADQLRDAMDVVCVNVNNWLDQGVLWESLAVMRAAQKTNRGDAVFFGPLYSDVLGRIGTVMTAAGAPLLIPVDANVRKRLVLRLEQRGFVPPRFSAVFS